MAKWPVTHHGDGSMSVLFQHGGEWQKRVSYNKGNTWIHSELTEADLHLTRTNPPAPADGSDPEKVFAVEREQTFLTEEEIQRLRESLEKVTHTPSWSIDAAEFFELSRNLLPSLLKERDQMQEALQRIPAALLDIQRIMRANGLKIDDLSDPMQKLAFTIYSALCELDLHARAALGAPLEEGKKE